MPLSPTALIKRGVIIIIYYYILQYLLCTVYLRAYFCKFVSLCHPLPPTTQKKKQLYIRNL